MTLPSRLSLVGDLERPDHFHLPADAICYFWGEYTPYPNTGGLKWNFSPTNRLISNFKKKMDVRGTGQWNYKVAAITQVATAFAAMYSWAALLALNPAFIPIPPSKARNDPMYDPRMLEMLNKVAALQRTQLDIRDCLSFDGRYSASHETDERPTPDQLYDALTFSEEQGRPTQRPGAIFLYDDMLTTGAHFVAACRKLREVFPGVPIYGQFVSRRLLPRPEDVFGVVDDL